jgi:hypothetical protein
MAALGQVMINGTMYSWANVQITMHGAVNEGITKIEYNRDLKITPEYAAGQEIYGLSYGQYTYNATVEMFTEEWRKISLNAGGSPLALAPFTIGIRFLPSYVPGVVSPQNGVVIPFKDVLYNCQYTKDGLASGTGEGAIKVSIPLIFTGLSRFNV